MKLRLLVLSCVLFSFTSCLDIIETFNINQDSGGSYEVKTDMSKALGMLAMMGGGKDTDKMPEKMDSSISFKEYVDTASQLTAEERKALGKGTITIHLNKEEGEMYMMMKMPFDNAKEYAVINNALSKMKDGQPMEGAFKGLFGGGMGDNPLGNDDADKGSVKKDKNGGLPSDNFVTFLTANSLSRKVKEMPKADAPKTDDMPEELKEMFKVNYTTVVNLPRPVKNITGAAGKLSDDKKQVKFSKKIDLSSGFTPGDFDFTIDF
jgi:hypothetical protein